jgi:hypothetical protein
MEEVGCCMSITDQKQRVASREDCRLNWSGGENGKYFRCGMCGHKFREGDIFRWVYMNSTPNSKRGNFLTCSACDGDDIRDRRLKWEREAETRFWQLMRWP